jgi:predicted amidohydrolase
MQNLTVTLVQAEQVWEDKSENLRHYESLLGELPETDLIMLPEMFHTSFTMNAAAHAEKLNGGKGINWLKFLAQVKQSCIYTSLIIEENNSFYNMGVFVRPDGKIETYAKRKTFGLAREDQHYAAGNKEQIVDLKGWKLQLQICYDLRFPEIVRNRMIEDLPAYDAILYVANWPEKRSTHWKSLLQARAIENQCYVIGLNRVGHDGNGLIYSGDSGVYDPLGESELLTPNKEEVKTIQLDVNTLKKTRNILPFLKDQ